MSNFGPDYRVVNGVRWVKINEDWLSTDRIESIRKPESGCVVIRTATGESILVHGVFSTDRLACMLFDKRYDDPLN